MLQSLYSTTTGEDGSSIDLVHAIALCQPESPDHRIVRSSSHIRLGNVVRACIVLHGWHRGGFADFH
jgi:hypothetical protein